MDSTVGGESRKQRAEIGFLVLISAIALVFFPSVASPFGLKQEFAPLAFSVALLYWVYRDGFSGASRSYASHSARAAGLYAAAAALSNVTARNAPEAWLGWSLLVLGLLLFLFGHLRLWSPAFPERFASSVFWTSLPISLLGIAQAVLPGRLNFGLLALGKMAAFSTLGNPQFVAAWLVFAVPLYPALVAARPKALARIGMAAVALAALTCLALTRSASGFLALAAGGTFCVLSRAVGPRMRRLLMGAAVLLLVAAVYLGFVTHTGRGRIMIWLETLVIWGQHPWLGVGLGQYNLHQLEAQHRFFGLGGWTTAFQQNAAFVLDAHNQYLQILAEQGLVGLALFLYLISGTVARARRAVMHDPLTRGLTVGWYGQLVFFLWNAPLFYGPTLFLFWTTAGLLNQVAHPSDVSAAPARGSRRLRVSAALLVVASVALFGTEFRSGALEKEGEVLLEKGPFPEAVQQLEAALRWASHNGYAWEKLAMAQYFAGDYEAALRSLQAAQTRFGDVGILYLEAEILTRRKDYRAAIPRLEFIRDAFPQHVTPSFALGQIFKAEGDYAQAEREFVRVLRLPDSPENLKLNRKKIAIQKDLAFRFLAEIRRRR